MALELDGEQSNLLLEALIDAYQDWNSAERLAKTALDLNLNAISSADKGTQGALFDLIDWSASQGRIHDLVIGAVNSNKGNLTLLTFSQSLGISVTMEDEAG